MNLTTEQIIEGNIKLAEFEGWMKSMSSSAGFLDTQSGEYIVTVKSGPIEFKRKNNNGSFNTKLISDFSYHKDWNELMRVLDKMQENKFDKLCNKNQWFFDFREHLKTLLIETELEASFAVIVNIVTEINKLKEAKQ